jgi:putative RNA 2'-phosphotransferase
VADRAVRVSKFLALHLRHAPEQIGLTLGPGGWVAVDELLRAAAVAGFPITREELDVAVAEPTKRRYAFDETGTRIRAVQGHSVSVDLGYTPSAPPPELFHGTHPGAVDAILREGLKPMERRHVHLSPDAETARVVGARRGKPVILRVDAGGMAAEGVEFFRADNGVWLVAAVPPERLSRVSA